MRTKTLALSALLGAIGTASAVAQTNVYSINAVGYINVVLQPGFNMIACQLTTTNSTIGALFNNKANTYGQSSFFKWNNSTSHYLTDYCNSTSNYSNGWESGGTITLNPGEAGWFENTTGHAITNTFVGTVPQGTNTVTIGSGFNQISSPVPFSGDLVTNMGLTNYHNNDSVFVWQNPASPSPHYASYYVNTSTGSEGYMNQWDSPGDPQVNVGQGFWYEATASISWVQIFEINP
jgi:hypothetical protein